MPISDFDTGYDRMRDEAFQRRCKRASRGLHLPTVADLQRLSPFMSGSVQVDMQAFAERLLPKVNGSCSVATDLRSALKALTMETSLEEIFCLMEVLGRAEGTAVLRKGAASALIERCQIYAAALGDTASATEVARRTLLKSENEWSDQATVAFLRGAIGWLAWAADNPFDRIGFSRFRSDRIEERADYFLLVHQRWLKERDRAGKQEKDAEAVHENPLASFHVPAAPPDGTMIVVSVIGGNKNNEFRVAQEQFKDIVGKPLPLVRTPEDLRPVLSTLSREFPHAAEVIAQLTSELQPGKPVRHRPTILVGSPGSGKSRFCRRYLELLGIYHVVYPCGGTEDAAMAGTARRWSGGEAALPLQMAAARKTACPGIILDEIEKVGTSRHNGNLLDALLAMLEPETSSQWFDRYLEAPVNLSGVLWLGTANSLEGWRGPLQDRCRILRFPEPSAIHLPLLASSLMADIVKDNGMRPEWATPLTGQELEAVLRVWQGGSVRKLRRYLERVLLAREHGREAQ